MCWFSTKVFWSTAGSVTTWRLLERAWSLRFLVQVHKLRHPCAEHPCPAYCANCVSPLMQSASDQSHRKEASCTFPRIASLFLAWPTEAQGTDLTGDWPWAQSLHNHQSPPKVFSDLYIILVLRKTQSHSPVCSYFSIFVGHIKIKQVGCLGLWDPSKLKISRHNHMVCFFPRKMTLLTCALGQQNTSDLLLAIINILQRN